MNITELLVTDKSKQRPTDLMSDDKEAKVRLSDFLQYPTLGDPEPNSDADDIVLQDLNVPDMQHPIAAELVARLVEATGTLEVLEVLHDAYGMWVDGDLVIDIEVDEWPDFWDTVLS